MPASRRLLALQEQKVPRARCVIMIEGCEESGSYDLPFYVDHLLDRIGDPSLVVCLDSGCGDWDRMWLTTSLRGIAAGTLEGARAERGRALGRRVGDRALLLPHRAQRCSRGWRTRRPAR